MSLEDPRIDDQGIADDIQSKFSIPLYPFSIKIVVTSRLIIYIDAFFGIVVLQNAKGLASPLPLRLGMQICIMIMT